METLRIGVAGLGTVGAGAVRILAQNAEAIAARAGRSLTVVAVSARDRAKPRGCDVGNAAWFSDPVAMAASPDIDVVVEAMGGAEGAARDLVTASLKARKSVVTANKALLATHGAELALFAERANVSLMFEAAVAGGIPVIKTVREALAGNAVSRIAGILNGTCNFILTRMDAEKMDFDVALAEAQRLGYAEANPSADIDGFDTAHKLALLASLAFGGAPDLANVSIAGIRDLSALDLQMAARLGYKIKLLGVAERTDKGIVQRVSPCLVPQGSLLADVGGVLNAVHLLGDAVGPLTLIGRGAGAAATGSAIVGDLVDVARGIAPPPLGCKSEFLKVFQPVPPSARKARRYIRLPVRDRSGVLAELTAILRDEKLSVESILQQGHHEKGHGETLHVPVILMLHAASDEAVGRAMEKIARLEALGGRSCCLDVLVDERARTPGKHTRELYDAY